MTVAKNRDNLIDELRDAATALDAVGLRGTAEHLRARADRVEELRDLVFKQQFMGGRRELFKAMTIGLEVTRALRRSRLRKLG